MNTANEEKDSAETSKVEEKIKAIEVTLKKALKDLLDLEKLLN